MPPLASRLAGAALLCPDKIARMDGPDDARIYRPDERPAIEVEIDGTWYAGELRAWLRRDDEWMANVAWSAGVADTRPETVAAEGVRLVEE